MRRSSLASAPQHSSNDDNNTSPVRSSTSSGSSFLGDKGSTDNTESFTLTYAAFTIPASVQKYDDTQYTILDCQREYEMLIDQTEKTLENLYETRLKSSQLLKNLHKTEQALDQAASASTSTNPFQSLLSLGSSNNNNNGNNGNPVNIASLGDNVSTIEYNDGSKYKGQLDTNRVRHGKGTYYYPSGTVYKGEWENGGRHGLGVCEFVSHNQYIGYWTQGRREGLGVFMFTKERKQMDLPIPWKQSPIFDQYALLATTEKEPARPQPSSSSATSSLVFPFFRKPKEEPQTNNTVSIQSELMQLFDDRERYEGMFLHDQRHGFGVYYFPDGSCYSGGWKNNRRHGKGAYFFTSGRIYVGDWINSQRHGNGVMKDHTGQILYKGEWVNDRKEGKGTQHDNGDWITAIWKANRIEKILYVELFPLKHRLKCILQRDCIVKNKSKLKYAHQNAFKDITIEWAR